jgi:hypothetical protein
VRNSIRDSFVTGEWTEEDVDAEDGRPKMDESMQIDGRGQKSMRLKNDDSLSDYNDSSADEFDSDELLNAASKLVKAEDEEKLEQSEEDKNNIDENGEIENGGKDSNDGVANKKGKKERLKQQFDAEFDQTNEHYNALKEEMEKQSKV